jgi:hypothetical protein
MSQVQCPRCSRPLVESGRLQHGGFRVCAHCCGFLEAMHDGFRSLMPGDLEKLPEETRWQLLRARAELRAQSS